MQSRTEVINIGNGKKMFLQYEDDKLQCQLLYQNGLREGCTTYYYDNGHICSKTYYKRGVEIGYYQWFDYYGRLYFEQFTFIIF